MMHLPPFLSLHQILKATSSVSSRCERWTRPGLNTQASSIPSAVLRRPEKSCAVMLQTSCMHACVFNLHLQVRRWMSEAAIFVVRDVPTEDVQRRRYSDRRQQVREEKHRRKRD